MAQQESLYQDHGCWYVRYWETTRNEDGTALRKHPACRLASVKDYPKRSEVIPLKNQFMDRLNRIGFTPAAEFHSWISWTTHFSRGARDGSLEPVSSAIGIHGIVT